MLLLYVLSEVLRHYLLLLYANLNKIQNQSQYPLKPFNNNHQLKLINNDSSNITYLSKDRGSMKKHRSFGHCCLALTPSSPISIPALFLLSLTISSLLP